MNANASRYRLVYWDSVSDKDLPVSPIHATGWLRAWLSDPWTRSEVLEVFAWLGAYARRSRSMDSLDLDWFVRPAIERALESGELVLVERAPIADWKPAIMEVPAEPAVSTSREESRPTKTWIEFRVENAAGEPMPNVRYEAKLVDGSKQEGVTGPTGGIRFEQIDPGLCEFKILEFDPLTLASAPAESTAEHWLEFEVCDAAGNPIPDARYELTLADGSTLSGALDSDGHARHEGVPAGDARLVLADFLSAEWDVDRAEAHQCVALKARAEGLPPGEVVRFEIFRQFAERDDDVLATIEAPLDEELLALCTWTPSTVDPPYGAMVFRASAGGARMVSIPLFVDSRGLQAKWAVPDAVEGHTVSLSANLQGTPDGQTAAIAIMERNWFEPKDTEIERIEAEVEAGWVCAAWVAPALQPPSGSGKAERRDFYFTVELDDKQFTSELLSIHPEGDAG